MPVLSCSAKLCLFSIRPKIALEMKIKKKKKKGREPLVLNHPHVSGTVFGAVFLPVLPIYFFVCFQTRHISSISESKQVRNKEKKISLRILVGEVI